MSTRTYDLIVLLDADAPTETHNKILTDTRTLITQHGDVKANKDWGNRQTPYRIDHHEEASFHVFQFETKPESIAQLDRGLKLMEGVLRFRIFQSEGGPIQDNPPTFKREERGYERPPANVAATPGLDDDVAQPAASESAASEPAAAEPAAETTAPSAGDPGEATTLTPSETDQMTPEQAAAEGVGPAAGSEGGEPAAEEEPAAAEAPAE